MCVGNQVRNLGYGNRTCLDSPARKTDLNKPAGLYPCHKMGGNQVGTPRAIRHVVGVTVSETRFETIGFVFFFFHYYYYRIVYVYLVSKRFRITSSTNEPRERDGAPPSSTIRPGEAIDGGQLSSQGCIHTHTHAHIHTQTMVILRTFPRSPLVSSRHNPSPVIDDSGVNRLTITFGEENEKKINSFINHAES